MMEAMARCSATMFLIQKDWMRRSIMAEACNVGQYVSGFRRGLVWRGSNLVIDPWQINPVFSADGTRVLSLDEIRVLSR